LAISIAAIKYSMLKQGTNNTIIFDKKEALNFEGNTGPYLLYSYARSRSIINKAKSKKRKIIINSITQNELNLITCTRQMNTVGMLQWENKVANYIKETNNNVLYRVTPKYESVNLLASGVQIEAYSIQDNGKGVKFNIFVKNIQDGIEIDYKTGDSKLIENNN
jgi:hypothetical protein